MKTPFEPSLLHEAAKALDGVDERALAAAQQGEPEALAEIGTALARRGDKGLAQRCWTAALAADPTLHKPLANLGSLALERGDAEAAAGFFERAVALVPGAARLHLKLGAALHACGRAGEAASAFERAAAIEPSLLAFHNLGLSLQAAGDPERAIDAFDRALALEPDAYPSHLARARALAELGRRAELETALRRCAAVVPLDREAVSELLVELTRHGLNAVGASLAHASLEHWPADEGILLVLVTLLDREGRLAAAEPVLLRASSSPDGPGPFLHLARLRAMAGDERAERAFLEEAHRRFPDRREPRSQLALALLGAGDADGALALLEALIREAPTPDVLGVAAMAALGVGDAASAMDAVRRAEAAGAGPETFQTAIALLTTNYVDDLSPEQAAAMHVRWAERAFPPSDVAAPRVVRTAPGSKLRVGYVSPDLREHSVARFVEPVLAAHDRSRIEITCYSTTSKALDATTERIRALDLAFRDVRGLSPREIAACIEADGIDVLVDLDGWMSEQRLEVFRLRPAPVQATYLGYPSTTGLAEMTWRITDADADPNGNERLYSERLLRLPRCAWAFRSQAPRRDGEPAARPFTFGSFNNLCKVTATTLDLWARILERVPGSRLLLKAHQLEHARARDRIRHTLERLGVDSARLDLRPHRPSHEEHLATYDEIDVALDTYPYNGTTTTCEALFAGVPVVTLGGAAPASGVGRSLLRAAGLAELVTSAPEAYVDAAASLASPAPSSRAARDALRATVEASELADVGGLVAALEDAFVAMATASVTPARDG